MISITKQKPWRNRAEVYIIKDNKIILGKPSNWNGYSIPGGGIERGETSQKAAQREALEEVGARCKNLRKIGTTKILYNPIRSKKMEWTTNWKGVIFTTYIAEFDGYDKSLWGKEIDSYESVEVSISDAIRFFKKHAINMKKYNDTYNYEKAVYVLEILNKIKR